VESYKEAVRNISTAKPEKSTPAKTIPAKKQAVVTNKEPLSPATGAAEKTKTKSSEGFRPHELSPITYWELPDAIRANVPEIKFSVLVYAKQPKDRFVLINGQRLVEGDSAQAGLVIEEIRRDGVVFSYRLYQFLVER
jgi:hypothetical protein